MASQEFDCPSCETTFLIPEFQAALAPAPFDLASPEPQNLDIEPLSTTSKRKTLIAVGIALIMLCWLTALGLVLNRWKIQFKDIAKQTREREGISGHLQNMLGNEKKEQEKVDKIVKVVQLRTQWMKVIDDICSRMPEGMWLTSFKPVIKEVNGVSQIKYIAIIGSGFSDKLIDKSDETAVEEFRDKLRASPHFTKDTKIDKQPANEPYMKQFEIWAALKEPFAFEEIKIP